jgi:YVTN family beta-propeller protein
LRAYSSARTACIALVALAASGCAGSGLSTGPGGATLVPGAAPLARTHRPPAPKTKYLYVSDTTNNAVRVFDPATGAVLSTITSGLAGPYGLAEDKSGNLYVANFFGGNVTVYGLNATTPSRTLVDGGESPTDVAVRNDGTIYVVNLYGDVEVYAPGSNSPAYRLTNSNLLHCYGVALDTKSNVYVSGRDGGNQSHVVKFKKNKTTGTDLGLTGLTLAYGLVFDNLNNLTVVDTLAPDVALYPAGATSPSVVFGNTGQPSFAALDKARANLYVGDLFGDDVAIYAYPSGTLVTTIPNVNGATTTGVAVYPAAAI